MGKVEQERSAIGNEFQIVGAAKVNERQRFAEQMSGTVRRFLKNRKNSRNSNNLTLTTLTTVTT